MAVRVVLVPRSNPTPVMTTRRPSMGAMIQHVATVLRGTRCLRPETRFRETRSGGLEVTGVEAHAIVGNDWLVNELQRYAAQHGFELQMDGSSFRMMPRRGVRARARANPRKGRVVKQSTQRRRSGRSSRANPAKGSGLPKAQIRWVVDRYSVGTPDATVAADMAKRTAAWPARQRDAAVRYAVECHHKNQKLYSGVMSGRLRANPARRKAARPKPRRKAGRARTRAGSHKRSWKIAFYQDGALVHSLTDRSRDLYDASALARGVLRPDSRTGLELGIAPTSYVIRDAAGKVVERGGAPRSNPSRGGLVRHASAGQRPSRARYPRASAAQRAKRDRCVKDVLAKPRGARSPWGICAAAIEKIAGHKLNFHAPTTRRKPAKRRARR